MVLTCISFPVLFLLALKHTLVYCMAYISWWALLPLDPSTHSHGPCKARVPSLFPGSPLGSQFIYAFMNHVSYRVNFIIDWYAFRLCLAQSLDAHATYVQELIYIYDDDDHNTLIAGTHHPSSIIHHPCCTDGTRISSHCKQNIRSIKVFARHICYLSFHFPYSTHSHWVLFDDLNLFGN